MFSILHVLFNNSFVSLNLDKVFCIKNKDGETNLMARKYKSFLPTKNKTKTFQSPIFNFLLITFLILLWSKAFMSSNKQDRIKVLNINMNEYGNFYLKIRKAA